MGRPENAGWNEPKIDRLKKLWGEGQSAAQIAADLGGGITRNAVIGKVSRLGLQRTGIGGGRQSQDARSQAAKIQRRNNAAPPKPIEGKPFRVSEQGRIYAEPEQVPLPPEPVVRGEPLMATLLELSPSGCKWPIGGPTPVQRFCGLRQDGEHPYCAEHAKAAYSSASSLAKHSASELVRSVRRYL